MVLPAVILDESELRKKLSPYKKVAPYLLDAFIWRHSYDPLLIGGVISLLFFSIYYYEPPFITFVSLLLLLLTVVDLVAPCVAGWLGGQEKPGNEASREEREQEQKFNVLVNRITYYSVMCWNWSVTVEEWRGLNPNWYSTILIGLLSATAWIGASVNNLFLAYLVTLFMGLLPGLLHRRVLEEYFGKAVLQIVGLLGDKKKE